jgi:hypothetical protein
MHLTHPLGRVQPHNHPDTHRFPPHFARQGFVGTQLRQTLLGERSLTPLWRVLRSWTPDPSDPAVHMDKLDIMKLWVRHFYNPDADLEPRTKLQRVLDIPHHELGTAQMTHMHFPAHKRMTIDEDTLSQLVALENDEQLRDAFNPVRMPVRKVSPKLLRVDELVMRESVRREMGLWEHWTRMMVWGWYDPAGRRLPMWSEEEMRLMNRGMVPVRLRRRALEMKSVEREKGEKGGGVKGENSVGGGGEKKGEGESEKG